MYNATVDKKNIDHEVFGGMIFGRHVDLQSKILCMRKVKY